MTYLGFEFCFSPVLLNSFGDILDFIRTILTLIEGTIAEKSVKPSVALASAVIRNTSLKSRNSIEISQPHLRIIEIYHSTSKLMI